MNKERIVRVRNDEIHDIINYVSKRTRVSYQGVFNILCKMLVDGFVVGDMTTYVLMDKVLERKNG